MDLEQAIEYLAPRHAGVLLTIRGNGRPQASNISYAWLDGAARISVTDDRAKTRNVRRDPRVSMHVTSSDFWSYVVVDGTAELSAVAAEPGDAACLELRRVYEAIRGEPHPDWDDYDAAMIQDRRLVLRLFPDHAYGFRPGP
jgi:PPOX class probable F420-dependent enzyme